MKGSNQKLLLESNYDHIYMLLGADSGSLEDELEERRLEIEKCSGYPDLGQHRGEEEYDLFESHVISKTRHLISE